jgi:type II secretory pathway pseudopilin PulG
MVFLPHRPALRAALLIRNPGIPLAMRRSNAFSIRASGFALLAALLTVLAVSLAAAVAVHQASLEARRERESQLLWVGNQYRQAISNYANLTGNGFGKQYPARLEDLLEDKRMPTPTRFLRRLYPDPVTGKVDWVLEMEGERIVGLHSRSGDAPVRHAGLGSGNDGFAAASSYSGWRFMAADAAMSLGPVAATWTASATGAGAANGMGADAGSDPDGSGQPVLASEPNLDGRVKCYMLYIAPKSACTQTPPPQGDGLISCMKAYAQQYNACIAALP